MTEAQEEAKALAADLLRTALDALGKAETAIEDLTMFGFEYPTQTLDQTSAARQAMIDAKMHLRKARPCRFIVGDRIDAVTGNVEDDDSGVVLSIDGDTMRVGWDTGTETDVDADDRAIRLSLGPTDRIQTQGPDY